MTDKIACLHCCRRVQHHRRRLCSRCYAQGAIGNRYVPARVATDFYGNPPAPAEPTDAQPGSPDKIEVLAARAQAREKLWHPLDR